MRTASVAAHKNMSLKPYYDADVAKRRSPDAREGRARGSRARRRWRPRGDGSRSWSSVARPRRDHAREISASPPWGARAAFHTCLLWRLNRATSSTRAACRARLGRAPPHNLVPRSCHDSSPFSSLLTAGSGSFAGERARGRACEAPRSGQRVELTPRRTSSARSGRRRWRSPPPMCSPARSRGPRRAPRPTRSSSLARRHRASPRSRARRPRR